jgi:hypothetical protein
MPGHCRGDSSRWLPGIGHGAPIQKPEMVSRMIQDFLAGPAEEFMMRRGSLCEPPTG